MQRWEKLKNKKLDVQYLNIDDLELWKEANVRTVLRHQRLSELAGNIASIGLEHPLLVKPIRNGKYAIFSGQRRFEACKLAQIKKVKCIVYDGIRLEEAKIFSLSENLYREKMTTEDIMNATAYFYKKYGKNIKKISAILGIGEGSIRKYLDYVIIPAKVKEFGKKCNLGKDDVVNMYNKFLDVETCITIMKHIPTTARNRDKRSQMMGSWKDAKVSDSGEDIVKNASKRRNLGEYIILLPSQSVKIVEREAKRDKITIEGKISKIVNDWVLNDS